MTEKENVLKFMQYIEKLAKAYEIDLPNRSYDMYAFAKDLLNWLERQGKTSADKIEPRFKVGDWIVFIKSKSIYQVEKKENYEYTLRHILGGSLCLPFSNEGLIREWTIQDAKDGDALSFYSEYKGNKMVQIGIIEKYVGKHGGCSNTFKIYAGVNWDNNLQMGEYMGCSINIGCSDIHPATKEQRDALMKAMNDAGYEWDADKKELKLLVSNQDSCVTDKKEKFDPKTLKPFDKVLVRDYSTEKWTTGHFSYIEYNLTALDLGNCDRKFKFLVYTNDRSNYWYAIPYNEDTKHLVGTTDDAPEYYKYWED